MIVAIIIGTITGWLMSMPIGPVNAAAISRTLKYNFKYGIAIGLGAAVMDFLYCYGAAEIHQFLMESPIIDLIFRAVGFVALTWLGVRTIHAARVTHAPRQSNGEMALAETRVRKMHMGGHLGAFAVGIVLYASNVAAVPEWIFVTALWRSYHILDVGALVNFLFAFGAGLGTAAWFLYLVRFIARRQKGLEPSTLHKINMGAGIAMLLFGIYFAYDIAFNTHWDQVQSHFEYYTGGKK